MIHLRVTKTGRVATTGLGRSNHSWLHPFGYSQACDMQSTALRPQGQGRSWANPGLGLFIRAHLCVQ